MVLGIGFGLIDTQAPWLEPSPELAAPGTPAASMDATHSGSAPSTLCVFCGPPGSSPSLRRGRTPSGRPQSTAATAPCAGLTLRLGPTLTP